MQRNDIVDAMRSVKQKMNAVQANVAEQMTDEEAVKRAAMQDPRAFEWLVRKYGLAKAVQMIEGVKHGAI